MTRRAFLALLAACSLAAGVEHARRRTVAGGRPSRAKPRAQIREVQLTNVPREPFRRRISVSTPADLAR